MSQKIVNSSQRYVSKEKNMFLRNAATSLQDYTVSQLRRSQPEHLLLVLGKICGFNMTETLASKFADHILLTA
jgi:hypothetical protein